MIDPYPLLWPEEQPRTPANERENSSFKVLFAKARDGLVDEIERLGGQDLVITSNLLPRKTDGLPLAGQSEPRDPGVAIYFWRKGMLHQMACDRWTKVKDNIRALGLSIGAIRGLDRWGTSGIVEKTIQAFAYLPPAGQSTIVMAGWWDVLGVSQEASFHEIQTAWRQLVHQHHPDKGGELERLRKINEAFNQARRLRGL